VDIKVGDGEYRIRWINAQDTSDRRDGGITNNGENLAAPDSGDDWLLYLTGD